MEMASSSPASFHTARMTSSTHSSLLGPESLPLFKLSFCTTATLQSKMIWTHLPHRDGMFAVFDQVRKTGLGGLVSEKRILKLVQGGDVLVCLAVLCSFNWFVIAQYLVGYLVFLFFFLIVEIFRSRSILMIWYFKYVLMRKECDHNNFKMRTFM